MVSEALVPPPTDDAFEPVSPLDGETVADDEPEVPQNFREGPVKLLLLPLYSDHTARHIWGEEVTLVRFIIFNLHLLLYFKFLTLFYFSIGPLSAEVY